MEQKTHGNFNYKSFLLMFVDFVVVNVIYFVMIFFHWNFRMDINLFTNLCLRIPFVTAAYILCNVFLKLYKTIWKYAGLHEVLRYCVSTVLGTIITFTCDYIGMKLCYYFNSRLYFNCLPTSVYLDSTLLIIAMCLSIRLAYRSLILLSNERIRRQKIPEKKIMIVGAGQVGNALITEFRVSSYRFGTPIVVVDDNYKKMGLEIAGVPITGPCENIKQLAIKMEIDEIIFSISKISDDRKREILEMCVDTGCKVKVAPEFSDLAPETNPTYKEIRNVDILDLLSRPEIKLNPDVCKYVTGKTILVTGGGGSIGSELCRQISKYSPEKIVIFDIYENNAYALKNSLDLQYYGTPQIEIRIGSVRELRRLSEVFEEFHPSSVFHAAAHKHVPLMEDSPYEAIKNNILGTYNTAFCANEFGVENFVLLSTDKAVNPTNVMGATKRTCELVVQYFSKITKGTKFAAVRFGNVLGSNGSVIPLFKEQLENGGPLTVTHPDITRYFMTIPEAAQLVVQAGGLANGGEIFVLDMGEPVKIVSLAEKLIKLSGFEPYIDIDIQFTGLRPGEKLYEELMLKKEKDELRKTSNDKIFITPPLDFDSEYLISHINSIDDLDPNEARRFLKELVPNFTSTK
ncbi:MAG: nucleoside-diphosphate sugar epimerase/dehydratase [Oscillospiraceae bacterium]